MNYTLHQLQVFLKVTQTKSITKAAEELNLTQPAVSIQLKNLQDQFEIPLTEIIGRQLYVTDFGKKIVNSVENILNEVEIINFKTSSYKGMLSGKLKLSVVSTGKYVLPYFLSEFTNENRGVELEMDVTNKAKVIEALKNNEVDFAFVSTLPKGLLVDTEIIMENKLFLISNKEILLNKNTKLDTILKDTPIIYREKGSATRILMEEYFNKNGISGRKKLQLTSNEAVKQAVIAGLGVSVMPLIGLKSELENKNVQIITMKGLPIISNWRLVWLKGKKLSPISQAYLNYIRKEKENVKNNYFSWINNF